MLFNVVTAAAAEIMLFHEVGGAGGQLMLFDVGAAAAAEIMLFHVVG